MGKFIRLKKGFDINLAGKVTPKVVTLNQPDTFAIKPPDFKGIYLPKVVVNEGDTVKAGTTLFHDKKIEDIVFTAPVSGEVVEIRARWRSASSPSAAGSSTPFRKRSLRRVRRISST